jgi:hypothetical protein
MDANVSAAEHEAVMGPLFTRVSFRVRCADTRFGETVAVCGELAEFGGWDPEQALRLHTTMHTFPVWQSDTVLIGSYVPSTQFKFVILPATNSPEPARWEPLVANRHFTPVGEEHTIAQDFGVLTVPIAAGVSSPELSALDVSAPASVAASLELPLSLAEVARRASPGAHLENPLDGSERVLMVMHRLPVVLSRDEASGAWAVEWDEGSMWATSVGGGRPILRDIGCELVYVGQPNRHVPKSEQVHDARRRAARADRSDARGGSRDARRLTKGERGR